MGTSVFANTPVKIDYEGLVSWFTVTVVKTSCMINIRDFPFDTQECKILLASWILPDDKIIIEPHSKEDDPLEHFVPDGEWEATELRMESDLEELCCPQNFSVLTMTFVIKRRPLFICFNLGLPCTLLLWLGVFVFLLTPESGVKAYAILSLLLALTVFLSLAANELPRTSDFIPLMCKYYLYLNTMIFNIIHRT